MKRLRTYRLVLAALVAVLLAACATTPTDVVVTGGSEAIPETAEEPATPEAEETAEALETLGLQAETSQGTREAGWYVDNNGDIFYIGKDGNPLTGWQQFGSYWLRFGSDGAAIKGWTSDDGVWYYCDKTTGVMVTDNPVEGAYWAASDGTVTEVGGKMDEGGSQSWTEVSGLNLDALIAYLEANADTYLGTVYDSWPCSVPGVGMHCVGFVDRAIYDAGFADGFNNNLAGTGYERYTYNNGNIYRADEDPYSNENCWHVGGWAMWAKANDLHWVSYRNHKDAMAGAQRGEFQKGDIMIYSTTSLAYWDYSGLEHIAFYWGDENNWSLVWESSPGYDNAIVSESYYTSPIYVLTSV